MNLSLTRARRNTSTESEHSENTHPFALSGFVDGDDVSPIPVADSPADSSAAVKLVSGSDEASSRGKRLY